jgi:hypothetical protein
VTPNPERPPRQPDPRPERWPAPPRAHRAAGHDARPRRGGEHAPQSSRSRRPTGPRPCRNPAAAQPAPRPRSHPPTSDDAGCRPSSSTRTTRADPATVTPSWFATTPRQPPDDGPSTGEPDEASGLATGAPTQPTPGRSSRGDHAHHVPTATRPTPYAGHALVHAGKKYGGKGLVTVMFARVRNGSW